MKDLLKLKENLEQQLASVNEKIDEAQNSKKLIGKIKEKVKELETLLSKYILVKVHYLVKHNRLVIMDYDADYIDLEDIFIHDYDEILYNKQFEDLHETLKVLNTAIKNHQIIANKLKIRSLKPLLYDYEYNVKDLIYDNIITIEYSDYVSTSFPEPFKLSLYADTKVSDTNDVKLTIHTIISYNYDIEKKYSKTMDDIEFDVKYNDFSDYTNRFEEFTCEVENVKIEEIYNTLQKVRTLTFSNSHLVKLSTFKN